MDKDLARFRECSFLFACGKLDEDEAAWMRAMLAQHPQWQAELDDDRRLVAQAQAGLAERYAAAPPLVSLDAVLRACAPVAPRRAHPILAWWRRCWQARVPAPWLAGVAAVLVASVALQASFPGDGAGTAYRGTGPELPAGPQIKVVFDDTLSLGALRALLAAQQVRVLRGPDEQGIVWLAATDGDVERALMALRAQPGVLDAQVVGGSR